jgi:hypothetical protein
LEEKQHKENMSRYKESRIKEIIHSKSLELSNIMSITNQKEEELRVMMSKEKLKHLSALMKSREDKDRAMLNAYLDGQNKSIANRSKSIDVRRERGTSITLPRVKSGNGEPQKSVSKEVG